MYNLAIRKCTSPPLQAFCQEAYYCRDSKFSHQTVRRLTDYLPKGKTITGTYYSNLQDKLRVTLKNKHRGMISRGMSLLPDNAPAHSSQVTVDKARARGFGILKHPPYYPDLAPSEFFLFPEMKIQFRGRRFNNTDDVINEVGQ